MILMNTIEKGHIYLKGTVPSYLSKGLDFKGNPELLDDTKKVSIIGSRKPTELGAAAARELTLHFIERDYTIVSGLALGIDTIAHTTALDHNGRTLAVIGTPIDRVYPKENKELFNRVIENGLLVSQFPIRSKTRPANFPQRNRTMAYLSDITVICDATSKSGTRHQAQEALKLGKKVYILQHVLDAGIPWANALLDKGVQPLSTLTFNFLAL
ncbi:DNA-processing protein DprA [Maribacter polysaccharolyticus]|uniref:DNA-processing protein DprA n=1 Tax=Maribacter polysaccharolyticus TaxID=3020831 RepID=UPI00237F3F14|nr:DNA-processing protein DprA [Maribacter polysaccharolyticus]MDE3744006.1 DNA-processing protein DprA [Maribacter polysaccharolyticus]